MTNYKLGEHITVKVGGCPYDTIIDPHGVQRFARNSVVDYLVDSGRISLNELSWTFQRQPAPPFTLRDYAEFTMMLGYSVAGFAELHEFESMPIENSPP